MADFSVPQHLQLVSLQRAVFCAECEVISENCTPSCLACGSRALLCLSRILGGSLRGQPTAQLILDAELDLLVRELLRTVPRYDDVPAEAPEHVSSFLMPSRHHARRHGNVFRKDEIDPSEINLEPAISVIAERAQTLTGATGAAIALRRGNDIVCRARTGRTAPDLGVRLHASSGISAECVRTGEVVLCNDAETHPHVHLPTCKRLGVRSILAAPLRHFRKTLGIFEVLSTSPYAFDDSDVSTMQLLSTVLVAAISRLAKLGSLGSFRVS